MATIKHYRPVEVLAFLHGVERIEARTIRGRFETILDASAFIAFVLSYDAKLEP
jgi:hypothetical protein